MGLASSENLQMMGQDPSGADWLTAFEAALYLRLFTRKGEPCVARLRNLVCQGRIPFYKPFGRLMFKRSELQKLIEITRQGNIYGNNEVLRRKRGA
ncbi:MAG: hypothetical protein BroJett040_07950 [Oligoflexia bacterium]|nr:MAG: hypothetical protein BroJett040_07950 [Oligoflexia bacterium]